MKTKHAKTEAVIQAFISHRDHSFKRVKTDGITFDGPLVAPHGMLRNAHTHVNGVHSELLINFIVFTRSSVGRKPQFIQRSDTRSFQKSAYNDKEIGRSRSSFAS